MTADHVVLGKAVLVLVLLGLALWVCGAGWAIRWALGMALGACLVAAAGLVLLAVL